MPRVYTRIPIEARFWAKVRKGDGCWVWTARKNRNGYGEIGLPGHDGGTALAHRLSFTFANGPIPSGLIVRHDCDNPSCVRPDHLRLGTMADNTNDMVSRGRHNNPKREKCVRGHNLNETGVVMARRDRRAPDRVCVVCRRERNRLWMRARRCRDNPALAVGLTYAESSAPVGREEVKRA